MDELERIALQARADEHADTRAAAERLSDFQDAAQSAPAPDATPEEKAKAEEVAQAKAMAAMVADQLPRMCSMIWGMIDAAAIKFAGAKYTQTPEQREQLAAATAPVALKHMPKDLSFLTMTPEGMLLFTALVVYVPKMLAEEATEKEVKPVQTAEVSA